MTSLTLAPWLGMGVTGTPVSSRLGCHPGQCFEQISFACVSVSPFCFGRLRGCFRLVLALGHQQSVLWCVNGGCRCLHVDHDSSNCSHSFSKIYVCPRGRKRYVTGVGSPERISMRTSAGVSSDTSGGGVGWGQAGSDFQLQNGLMQFVLLILSLMLGFTPADAHMKRSQSAKVEFKHPPLRPNWRRQACQTP